MTFITVVKNGTFPQPGVDINLTGEFIGTFEGNLTGNILGAVTVQTETIDSSSNSIVFLKDINVNSGNAVAVDNLSTLNIDPRMGTSVGFGGDLNLQANDLLNVQSISANVITNASDEISVTSNLCIDSANKIQVDLIESKSAGNLTIDSDVFITGNLAFGGDLGFTSNIDMSCQSINQIDTIEVDNIRSKSGNVDVLSDMKLVGTTLLVNTIMDTDNATGTTVEGVRMIDGLVEADTVETDILDSKAGGDITILQNIKLQANNIDDVQTISANVITNTSGDISVTSNLCIDAANKIQVDSIESKTSDGTITVGDDVVVSAGETLSTDTLNSTSSSGITVGDSLVPDVTGTNDLGSVVNEWRKLYVDCINASGDVTIAGNLTISGNTTSISTENLVVEDNKIFINNPPGGIGRDAGFCISRFQNTDVGTGAASGDVVNDTPFESANVVAGVSSTVFQIENTVSGGASGTDYYTDWFVRILDGPLAGEVRTVESFDGANVTVSTAFSSTPTTSDVYALYPCRNIALMWDEGNNKVNFTCSPTANIDAEGHGPIIDNSTGERLDLVDFCVGEITSYAHLPTKDKTYDLGSASKNWETVYANIVNSDVLCATTSVETDTLSDKSAGFITVTDPIVISSAADQIRFQGGIEIGNSATNASTGYSISIGKVAISSGTYGIAMGTSTTASGSYSIAIGYADLSSGLNSIAIGPDCGALGNNCVTIGKNNTATAAAANAIVIGATNTIVTVADSIVLGQSSPPGTPTATAWGQTFQDKSWADSTIGFAKIDGSGNLFKDSDGVDISGNVDMLCNHISNVESVEVNTILSKADTLAVANTIVMASDKQLRFSSGIEIGNSGTSTSSSSAVAIGKQATTGDSRTVAVGYYASSGGYSAISIGYYANASTSGSIAIGKGAQSTTGTYAIAIGGGTDPSSSPYAIAENAIAIGRSSRADGTSTLAIGYEADAGGSDAISIGRSADASASQSAAIGRDSTASGSYSVAIGYSTTASSDEAIAMGYSASASGNRSTSLGSATNSIATYSVSVGFAADAETESSISIGSHSEASGGIGAISIGGGDSANGEGTSTGAKATALDAIAIGRDSAASGTCSIAIGGNAGATAANVISIGCDTTSSIADSINLGSTSPTSTTATAEAWGQIFSDRSWVGGGLTPASIDDDGNIIRGNADATVSNLICATIAVQTPLLEGKNDASITVGDDLVMDAANIFKTDTLESVSGGAITVNNDLCINAANQIETNTIAPKSGTTTTLNSDVSITGNLNVGGCIQGYCRTVIETGTYDILETDQIIAANTKSGAITVNLPYITDLTTTNKYLKLNIVDEGGCASANSITINANIANGDTILGGNTIVLSGDFNSLSLYSDGTAQWFAL